MEQTNIASSQSSDPIYQHANKSSNKKPILIVLLIIFFILSIVLIAQNKRRKLSRIPTPMPTIPSEIPTQKLTLIKQDGGRVDWSYQNNLIAFDKRGADGYYDVYTMKPDGSGEICLTCNKSQLPNKNMGNPAWHPSGDYIVFQAESPDYIQNSEWATPGKGRGNELWLTDKLGENFYQFTKLDGKQYGGVLHPHFSHAGTKLFWAERVAQGKPLEGWALQVADFVPSSQNPALSNIQTYQPGPNPRFYESHGFTLDDSKLIFSGNPENQTPTGFDIYTFDLNTQELKNLTNTPSVWDEHAQLSPDGAQIIWASSQGLPIPYLDLWTMKPDGSEKKQLTFFNNSSSSYYIGKSVTTGDSTWNAAGNQLLFYLITDTKETGGMNYLFNF